MADISRDTYDKSKRQNKVVFQEKKPLLNYELNLVQEILNEKSINLSQVGTGDNYVGDSFTVYPSAMPNEIFIRKGLYYHNGYPIELTEDIRINGLSTPSSDRLDTIFAEWYLDEISGTDDPSIIDSNLGFETSVQERIVLEIKIRENAEDVSTSLDPAIPTDVNPNPVLETITFNNSNKTISLSPTSGNVFPDWLIKNFPSGVTFTTSDPHNPGPFTINSSSPLLNKKTLVVNETLIDTPPFNTTKKLTFFDSNSKKSWIADRRNYFKIANLHRTLGNAYVSSAMVEDVRDKAVYNFVINGCSIEKVTSQSVKVNPGRLIVGDVEHFIEVGTENLDFSTHPPVPGVPPVFGQLLDNTLNFVFINKAGNFECSQTQPLDYHVLLAEVYTKDAEIVNIIDRRKFIPIAWKNKYAEGGGDTNLPRIVHQYRASEDISSFDAVAIKSGTTKDILRATATDIYSFSLLPNKLPVIGIAEQSIRLNHIDNVVTFGEVKNPSWSFTKIGSGVYLDISSGQITQNPPFTLGTFTQRIGVAVASDILFVNPEVTYIKNNPAVPFDTNFLVKRSNGLIEESTGSDRFSPDKMSFLASVAQNPNDKTFDIYPGRYLINDTEGINFSGLTVNLGTGTYQTSPLSLNYFNKAFFTLDDLGNVNMYESIESSASSSVSDPEIPDNEMPLSMVIFQDNGSGGAGTIKVITQSNIVDKRSWLNLGNIDNIAFKPVYRNNKDFLIQKGESWFNNFYIKSSSNILVTGDTSSAATYYIYMDLYSSTGVVTSGSFVTMLSTPSQVDRRRYIPLGEYIVDSSSNITRSSFKSYKSKFWKYRDTPYTNEQTFNLSSAGDSAFTLSSFTFLNTDFLDITINGRKVYEGDDYTKVAPNLINFAYTVKKGAKIKVRKV